MDVSRTTDDFSRRAWLARGLHWAGGAALVPVAAHSNLLMAHEDAGVACQAEGNVARLLSDDSTSLLHRLNLLDTARAEILLSAYEVGDCLVALRILAGLRAAAQRGVVVKLLIDGHGVNNLIPKPLMEYLIGQGVAIREHQPDVRYKLEVGRQRMHDKLLIVDGQRLVIGGRNVRADYYGMGQTLMHSEEEDDPIKDRWDRDAYVEGPIVTHARQYFLARWGATTSGQPSLDRREKRRTRQAQQLAQLNDLPERDARACAARLLDTALATPLPWSETGCQQHAQACQCETSYQLDRVRFLHDIPDHPKDCPSAIAHQLNCAISAARCSILIESPYLVMTRQLRQRLVDRRQQGVEVCLLTNSLQTNDKTIAHAQYANERSWLMAAGIELWEMKGCRQLHAKSMVIDGCRAMIGSYNFDVLSETRNSETALLIDSAAFASALTQKIGTHMLSAIPVTEPLRNFDARTNDIGADELREARIKRLISPWIKKYL